MDVDTYRAWRERMVRRYISPQGRHEGTSRFLTRYRKIRDWRRRNAYELAWAFLICSAVFTVSVAFLAPNPTLKMERVRPGPVSPSAPATEQPEPITPPPVAVHEPVPLPAPAEKGTRSVRTPEKPSESPPPDVEKTPTEAPPTTPPTTPPPDPEPRQQVGTKVTCDGVTVFTWALFNDDSRELVSSEPLAPDAQCPNALPLDL